MKIRNVPYDPRAATGRERLCSGPKRLGWSLGVYKDQLDGKSLFDTPFALYNRISGPGLLCGPRVGVKGFMVKERKALPREEIEEAAQRCWRYADRSGLAFVSLQTKDRERSEYPLSALQNCRAILRGLMRASHLLYPSVDPVNLDRCSNSTCFRGRSIVAHYCAQNSQSHGRRSFGVT